MTGCLAVIVFVPICFAGIWFGAAFMLDMLGFDDFAEWGAVAAGILTVYAIVKAVAEEVGKSGDEKSEQDDAKARRR